MKKLQFPGTNVITTAAVTCGKFRLFTPQEQAQGLVAIPITKDAIAIFIGNGKRIFSLDTYSINDMS
jgi:hypothetical protein